jgi:hypothetical protein
MPLLNYVTLHAELFKTAFFLEQKLSIERHVLDDKWGASRCKLPRFRGEAHYCSAEGTIKVVLIRSIFCVNVLVVHTRLSAASV